MILAVYPEDVEFGFVDSLLVSLLAILIVFAILALIIAITFGFQKTSEVIDEKTKINPRPENAILEEDEDAVAAVIAATIAYHQEFATDARLISISKMDEE